MTPEQFAYWLQGFSELHPDAPSPEQWRSIREHLGTVFGKVTPPLKDDSGRLKDTLREIQKKSRDFQRPRGGRIC